MSADESRIPASSQTVGPYFRIGLDCLIERTPAISLESPGTIVIQGQVFDRDGVPVPDAMLEFWCASTEQSAASGDEDFPAGFRRAATGGNGEYSVTIERPAIDAASEGAQAPHFMVLVFARGLLRQLLTRVYLGDVPACETDQVLRGIPEARRATLIAVTDENSANVFHWNVKLQGADETVFFAW